MINCATLVSHSVSPATSVWGVTGSHGFLSSSSWSISSASPSHAMKAARPSSASKFFCQGGQACSRFPVWDVTYMGDGQPYPCCIGRSRPSYSPAQSFYGHIHLLLEDAGLGVLHISCVWSFDHGTSVLKYFSFSATPLLICHVRWLYR